MWKILLLSSFLTAVRPENIDTFIGDWWILMSYPGGSLPSCLKYSLAKDPGNLQCNCTGERNATFMVMKLKEGPKQGPRRPPYPLPMFPVNSSDEVEPLLNLTCRCGDEDYQSAVVKQLSSKYIVLYEKHHNPYYTAIDKNTAYVMGMKLPKMVSLLHDTLAFEDLKNRNGIPICTSEIYNQQKKRIYT